jgi:hypothetical protein
MGIEDDPDSKEYDLCPDCVTWLRRRLSDIPLEEKIGIEFRAPKEG